MREVLIADGDVDRAKRIAAACRSLDIGVRVVAHGAAALEVALSEKPTAMVAQIDLPLIDGTRLAAILQANPHTRAMSVLFVGDGQPDAAPAAEHSGRLLPSHADPDTIARFIRALLNKRAAPARAPAASPEPGVEGKLSQISLAELIDLFHVNRKTGVIEVRQGGGRRAETGRLHLRGGDVIQARTGAVSGEKAFYRLLGWRRGTFAFREEAVEEPAAIERPARALLREWQRQAEEAARSGGELPARHARVALEVAPASLPNVLHPLTREVLVALEHSERVQQVLDRCSYPDYQVLRTLQTLARRGMVEIRADAGGREAPVAGLFAPAVAARLRDWLDQTQGPGGPPDAKVVMMASHREGRSDLVSLLAQLPSVQRIPRGDAPGIWPTLRITVDEDVAIEIVEAPPAVRFAPIWPVAAHGALATLFVHSGVEASMAALGMAVQHVGAMPRSRCFHVLLEDKPGGAAVLCERLGLFDDRRVLAVSPERPEEAAGVLRDLLARIVP